MKVTYSFLSVGLSLILLTGGCSFMGGFEDKDKKAAKSSQEQDIYASVQEYTGEGFYLPNSSPVTVELAKKHKDEITKAVEEFFMSNYKTPVTVHNLVGAQDAISVFVESKGEPHFYTLAIVPVNLSDEEVLLDKVAPLEGEIENSIQSGLYGMIYKEGLEQLDDYIEDVQKRFPVTTKQKEAIENTQATGFTKPAYYISNFDQSLEELSDRYIENPMDVKNLIISGDTPSLDPMKINITISLFMNTANEQPRQNIINQISEEIKKNRNLPPGIYNVILNDNQIIKRTGTGVKDNSLKTVDESIIIR
ncbi:DUF1672 family protein [Metabacillus mangrovi]|nr:DUF1672 family protein [Metabacillus mangrovi]